MSDYNTNPSSREYEAELQRRRTENADVDNSNAAINMVSGLAGTAFNTKESIWSRIDKWLAIIASTIVFLFIFIVFTMNGMSLVGGVAAGACFAAIAFYVVHLFRRVMIILLGIVGFMFLVLMIARFLYSF